MDSEPKVDLWMSLDNTSRLVLSVPLAKCSKFAIYPLKWLRFLGSTIYGREGYLSTWEGGPEINDYMAAIQACSYYYISDYEPCLVDTDAVDERTSSRSHLSIHAADFRRRIIKRDGTCLITGYPAVRCAACHIIPHSKGDNYISNISKYRGGSGANDHIIDINDTRNGLLLHVIIHNVLETVDSAFLKTPNFAMAVEDVPYVPQRQDDAQKPSSRLTLQHFADADILGPLITHFVPNNSDARRPQNKNDWPPAIIIDQFYGSAALKAWGSEEFIEFARNKARNAYYDVAEDNDVGSVDVTGGLDNSSLNSPQAVDDLMDGIMALWMQHSKKTRLRQESTHASDQACDENIKMWLRSVENPENPST